ncbi:DUF2283 domain-containing protein [Rhodothermus marinus]|uniref:DUF2283 domain-containing protein n=1 Tax=Rhodothermus marinus TaxID=29549 RepID=UPI0012BA3ECD|nr:DUF2283 domain-containing protein [Rhodothermus marinus]MBO2491777.1 DUF2283 domain-containing protein [Rhodothermus marinus]BBM68502.1 hypothetical protein RmaAA213_03480 [Rhodothermus marinus]BBM71470.1 hypothetical protein RmaAA338_03350 [Rhodothermus marinus]
MRLKIDEQADALYLALSDQPVAYTEEVAPGILLDYNKDGQVVGIELLYLSRRVATEELRRLLFESVPAGGETS